MSTVSQTGSRPGALEAMIHRSNDVGELLREDDSLLRQQFFAILKEHSPKVRALFATNYVPQSKVSLPYMK